MAYPTDIRSIAGVVGNGTTDDTAAIQAALNANLRHIAVTPGEYKVSGLVIPQLVRFYGMGGLWRKGANGPGIIANGAGIRFLGTDFWGGASTYTGVGVEVQNANDFIWEGGDIMDTQSYCFDFTVAAGGSRAHIRDCMAQVNTGQIEAIRLPALEVNGNRHFSNIRCAGGKLIDFGGCSTSLVNNCDTIGYTFRPDSKKVGITGGRFSASGMTMHGRDHVVNGVIFAGSVLMDTDCRDSAVVGNRILNGGVTDLGVNNVSGPNAVT